VRALAVAIVTVSLLAAPACGIGAESEPPLPSSTEGESFAFTGGDVSEGEPIDPRFTCDGENVSPALAWEIPPDGTAELALFVDDPAAPGRSFIHWVVFGIPPDRTEIETGRAGGVEGPNSTDGVGWTGPCPPSGETHGYVFSLYALDDEMGLEEGATLDDLRLAMDGHVLGVATLTAPYSRP
jgi:Raf kinase inhibitor-like YbhB/YbcL family protein